MKKENFLPEKYADDLEAMICNRFFPWYWNESTLYIESKTESKIDFQFTHTFFDDGEIRSDLFEKIKPIIYFLEKESGLIFKNILKVKANLMVRQNFNENELKDLIHFDNDNDNTVSFVYYVNDSDGETVLYKENGDVEFSCQPCKNTIIWFNSNKRHRPTPPVKNKQRVVLNFVFEV